MPALRWADDAEALLGTLQGHNTWATRAIIDRSEALSEAQFHQCFQIGPGSIHNTLLHIIAAMQRWTDRLLVRTLRPSLDAPDARYSPAQLGALLDEAQSELGRAIATLSSAGRLQEPLEVVWEGRLYRFSGVTAIAHVLTHGVHHRAQIVNMFRQLGLAPLGLDLDVVEWECVQTGQIES